MGGPDIFSKSGLTFLVNTPPPRQKRYSIWVGKLFILKVNNQKILKIENFFIQFLELSDKNKFWKKNSQVKEKYH